MFGVSEEDTGKLRVFTRVLSDRVYRTVVFDVVVHPEFRGQGLVRMIFDEMTSHPDLKDIEQLVLYCTEDVVGLYEKWDFTQNRDGTKIMIRKRPLRA